MENKHCVRLCDLQEHVRDGLVPFVYLCDPPVATNYDIINDTRVGDVYNKFHVSMQPLYKHSLLIGAHPSCLVQLSKLSFKRVCGNYCKTKN